LTWDKLLDDRLLQLRGDGNSWDQIAGHLGTTAESARKRHRRLSVSPTGENRMGSVLADVQAEFSVQTNQCQACAWIAARPAAEQREWDEVMATPTIMHRAIFRAMRKRGFERGDSTVANHRNSMHRLKPAA
jgi:hypothetical protein